MPITYPRTFYYPYRIASVTTARTLLYFTAGTYPCRVLESSITQESGSAEQLVAGWRKVISGTPTATALTASKMLPAAAPAATITAYGNVTASDFTYGAAAAGAAIVNSYGIQGFTSTLGYYYFDDGSGFEAAAGETYGLYLFSTPSTGLALAVAARIAEVYT